VPRCDVAHRCGRILRVIPDAKGTAGMLRQRNGRLVYLALALAAATAILSAERPGDPYRQARLLLLTVGPEATVIAVAMATNAEAFVSP
jgi:hypothetical protein